MAGRAWLVVLASGAIGFGAALGVGACGDDDRGGVTIEGGTTGTTGTTGTVGTVGTDTAPTTVDTSATDPAALDAAMAEIAGYAREQTTELVAATEELRAAVRQDDLAAAQRAYAAGRPYYERIEPLVALFPELDGKIDAREDDFPKKANDPAWTGFHPIERQLWHDGRITATTRALASRLVADSMRLDELMGGAEVPPEVVIPGTAELVDEIEESKITGEEERYSKLDLPTFLANLEGSHEFYEALEGLVEANDGELHEQIEEAFDAAFAEVESLKRGGRFVAYDELGSDEQKAVKQRIEALAEPLARVQGTLGVSS